jgi:opacity protein-like surface antigen
MRRAKAFTVLMVSWLLLAPSTAGAQNLTITSGVKAGIAFNALPKAGEVLDPLIGTASVDTSSKTGLVAGGFVQFAFSERLSFQPELLFVMKGVKLDEAANGGTVTAKINYLEFPLLARYGAAIGNGLRAYALVGPTFGLKASSSAHVDEPNKTVDVDIDRAIRSFEAGLALGGGVERGPYLLEARFTVGLNDIANDTVPHVDALRNRTIAIVVGIRFK